MSSYEYIVYSITTRCNLNCAGCFRIGTGEYDLPLELFRRSIPMAKRLGCACINLSGGEPLVHTGWRSFIKICKSANLTCFLSTNGLLIEDLSQPELIDLSLLALPLDGHCAAINDRIRCPGHFEKIIWLIRKYREGNFPFILKINTVVTTDNYEFLESILDVFADQSQIIWKLFQFAPRGEFASTTGRSVSSDLIRRKVRDFLSRKNTKCTIIYLSADSAGNYLIVDPAGHVYIPAKTFYNRIGSILDEATICSVLDNTDLPGNTIRGQLEGTEYG
ncbi:MAG: radical SAM protein [Planctomycetota bacterium]